MAPIVASFSTLPRIEVLFFISERVFSATYVNSFTVNKQPRLSHENLDFLFFFFLLLYNGGAAIWILNDESLVLTVTALLYRNPSWERKWTDLLSFLVQVIMSKNSFAVSRSPESETLGSPMNAKERRTVKQFVEDAHLRREIPNSLIRHWDMMLYNDLLLAPLVCF